MLYYVWRLLGLFSILDQGIYTCVHIIHPSSIPFLLSICRSDRTIREWDTKTGDKRILASATTGNEKYNSGMIEYSL